MRDDWACIIITCSNLIAIEEHFAYSNTGIWCRTRRLDNYCDIRLLWIIQCSRDGMCDRLTIIERHDDILSIDIESESVLDARHQSGTIISDILLLDSELYRHTILLDTLIRKWSVMQDTTRIFCNTQCHVTILCISAEIVLNKSIRWPIDTRHFHLDTIVLNRVVTLIIAAWGKFDRKLPLSLYFFDCYQCTTNQERCCLRWNIAALCRNIPCYCAINLCINDFLLECICLIAVCNSFRTFLIIHKHLNLRLIWCRRIASEIYHDSLI